MKEWSNQFNSFNSVKVLIWREWLEGIARNDFLPPIEAVVDLSRVCNYECRFCNAAAQMSRPGALSVLPEDHLMRLADFFAEWGIKAVCLGGGGEPMVNKSLPVFVKALYDRGIESGITSNGSLSTDDIAEALSLYCRFAGFSVDAATAATYGRIKGGHAQLLFETVIHNMRSLVAACSRNAERGCDTCFKFLIHPDNAHEILAAAKLAKSLGVRDFHVRPVCLDHINGTENAPAQFGPAVLAEVEWQMNEAMTIEDENFHVYGVRHKFNPDMTRRVAWTSCRASALILVFAADGTCQLCVDRRGQESMILCNHYPDPREVLKHWNSPRHHAMIDAVKVNECPRCTVGPYNEIVEQVFVRDGMCRNFP